MAQSSLSGYGRPAFLVLVIAVSCAAEIVDRIAVTVDRSVITESAIIDHLRVTALLNHQPVDLNPQAKRAAAGRLVEQALIRNEIDISFYPMPSDQDVDELLEKTGRELPPGHSLHQKLEEYAISEDNLREALKAQLVILRFIEYRFRPGITVTDAEVRQYYQEEFLPSLEQKDSGPVPGLEDSRDEIEEIIVNRRVNEALDQWLERAKSQAEIRYREEAFQ